MQPAAHPLAVVPTEEAGQLLAEHPAQPQAELGGLVGGVRSLGDDAVDDPRPPQVGRPHALALPGQLMRLAIRTNRLRPVPSLAEAEADPERAAAEAMSSNAIVGSAETAVRGLRELAATTGADELMLSASTHGVAERIRSIELIAATWGLAPSTGRTAA